MDEFDVRAPLLFPGMPRPLPLQPAPDAQIPVQLLC